MTATEEEYCCSDTRSCRHLFTNDCITPGTSNEGTLIDRCRRTHVGLFIEHETIIGIFISSIRTSNVYLRQTTIPDGFASPEAIAFAVKRGRIYEDFIYPFFSYPPLFPPSCFPFPSIDRSCPTRPIQQNRKVSCDVRRLEFPGAVAEC